MTSAWEYALTIGPLALYLGALAAWHVGRSPKVVAGVADHAMLCLGVGGLVAFGPVGQALTRAVSRQPDWLDRTAVVSTLGLAACLLGRGARRRVVVYGVDADRLTPALADALGRAGVRSLRTPGGFEDPAGAWGLRVVAGRRSRCATLTAVGAAGEGLLRRLVPALRARLKEESGRRSPGALYAVAVWLTGAALAGLVVTQPRARALLRALVERLRG